MFWPFRSPETTGAPEPIDDDTVEAADPEIVETPYTGCAWCGDGDGEGICPACEARVLAQSAARHRG